MAVAPRRVGVFVDVTHQFTAVNERHAKKINYEKYLARAVGNDHLYHAYAYGVQMGNEAAGFIRRLRQFGFETKYQQANVPADGKADLNAADFTVQLFADIMRHFERLETVVLGFNDPRLITMIQFLQERGIRVVIFACGIPSELANVANVSIEMPEDILEKGRITNASASS